MSGGTIKGCKPLSDQEIEALKRQLAGQAGGRDLALFMLGITTGFRISELLSLRIGDVAAGTDLHEWITVRRRHMKGKHEGRSMPLHPQARRPVAAWVRRLRERGYGDDVPLFVSRKRGPGGRPRSITSTQAGRMIHRACRLAGIDGPTGTHSMRKTIARRVADATDDNIFRVQKVLGHRNVNSTLAYMRSMARDEIEDLTGGLHFGDG